MGNHKMEHHCLRVNTSSLIVLKAIIVETWRQLARVLIV
jgi:hypothetical protein